MNLRIALGSLCAILAACGQGTLVSPQGPVWTETSRSLEVSCISFFQGSMRFVATRDQLSASQIDMLSRMTVIDGDQTSCFSDYMGCIVTIGDADGRSREVDAIESNIACGHPLKMLSWETFNPFRLGLGCQYSKDLTNRQTVAPVTADQRCYNGVFTNGEESLITVTLGVDDAAPPYRIELDDCAQPGRAGKLSFTVFDNGGATTLGSSAAPADPGPDGTCAALDLTFPSSGGFPLQIAVAAGATPGDLALRFY